MRSGSAYVNTSIEESGFGRTATPNVGEQGIYGVLTDVRRRVVRTPQHLGLPSMPVLTCPPRTYRRNAPVTAAPMRRSPRTAASAPRAFIAPFGPPYIGMAAGAAGAGWAT